MDQALKNSAKYKYPTRYELKQTLGEVSKRNFVEDFAKSIGVFASKATQTDLAELLSGIFFEDNELEIIRDAAYRLTSKSTLSGFIVGSTNKDFDLVKFFDELKISDKLSDDYTLTQIVQDETNPKLMRASIEYIKRTPGKIEFLQEENRSFEFNVEELDEGVWKVLVECNKSTDSNELKNIIEKNTDRKTTEFDELDIESLTSEQTIEFFDKLVAIGMDKQWKFIDIKHLIFRKGNEDGEEVDEEQLSGITQAKLEGRNLRDNSFVKESEQQGYRFTAMTYEFEDIKEGCLIQVSAEFKMRPKIFEVSVKDYKRREGIGNEMKYYRTLLKSNEEINIKVFFWNRAKSLFKQMVKFGT